MKIDMGYKKAMNFQPATVSLSSTFAQMTEGMLRNNSKILKIMLLKSYMTVFLPFQLFSLPQQAPSFSKSSDRKQPHK